MNVGEYQFSATLLMALLTLSLAFVLPRKVGLGGDVNRSRWLLATGTLLLAVHFYLQYRLGFRTAGNVDDSVFLNLLFFFCLLADQPVHALSAPKGKPPVMGMADGTYRLWCFTGHPHCGKAMGRRMDDLKTRGICGVHHLRHHAAVL